MSDTSTVVDTSTAVKLPVPWAVLLHNDDFTPMNFVVEILMTVFQKSRSEANSLMWKVHNQQKAVAGVFTREVAETKVALVIGEAERRQHPFLATMEPA